jgi:pimeloyl-ACP methyl ester carboxylesterase
MQTASINLNGLTLHYYRTGGDKPPLICLHGIMDSGRCWSGAAASLAADYDCIMPDMRGHGRSDAPASGYTPADHTGDILALMDALGIGRAVLMGHSMGGMVATQIALQAPERVRGLVLEDPAWPTPPAEDVDMWAVAAVWKAQIQEMQAEGPEALVAGAQEKLGTWLPADVEAWIESKFQMRPVAADYIASKTGAWQDFVAQLEPPTLLFYPDPAYKGVIISAEMAAQAQALNPRIKAVQILEAGHSLRRDQMGAFLATLGPFLAALPA